MLNIQKNCTVWDNLKVDFKEIYWGDMDKVCNKWKYSRDVLLLFSQCLYPKNWDEFHDLSWFQ